MFRDLAGVAGNAYSPDGRYVLSGGNDNDKTVRLWDAKTGKEVRPFNGRHDRIVWGVAFSKDGHRALSGSADGTVRLWDVDTGELLARLEEHTGWVRSVAFSPDGNLAVSGGGGPAKDGSWVDCSVRVWDLKTRKEVQRYQGHRTPVWSVVFLPDGCRALSTGGPVARLWDIRSGKNLRGFKGHLLGTNSVALSPDGRSLATGSDDHTVRVWDLETGNELPPEVAAPANAAQGAFVRLGGKGVAERKFDTLAEAVGGPFARQSPNYRMEVPANTTLPSPRARSQTHIDNKTDTSRLLFIYLTFRTDPMSSLQFLLASSQLVPTIVVFYHRLRPHQGKENEPPTAVRASKEPTQRK